MTPVRKASPADLDTIVATMARAFLDDPIMRWVQPNEAKLPRALSTFFRTQLRGTYLSDGETYTADADAGGVAGAAMWAPPGKARPGIRDLLRMAPMLPALGMRTVPALKLLSQLDKEHPHDVPHFYLGGLGTEPALQGKGYGSALLQPVLDRCDSEGFPAYLESSKERNVPFYARHGWKVTKEYRVPGGDERLWLMWREPG